MQGLQRLPGRRTAPPNGRRLAIVLTFAMLTGGMVPASAQVYPAECGAPAPVRGDYIGDRRMLELVERFHFTARVEQLVGGQGGGRIGSDIDYTLRSFPNHHRALVAMRRLAERDRADPPLGASTTVECYYRRAVVFREDDTVARMLYADFLIDRGRRDDAASQLKLAEHHAADNPLTIYNLGLLYAKLKDHDTALALAHRALALGFPRTGLRETLAAAGAWRDPPEAAAGEAPTKPPRAD